LLQRGTSEVQIMVTKAERRIIVTKGKSSKTRIIVMKARYGGGMSERGIRIELLKYE